jgi:ferritin
MLDKQIENALSEQINAEFYSAYLYYSMAAYFETLSLKGFGHWMRVQALEELTHTHKFEAYILDRGGRSSKGAIDAPPAEWESPLKAFEETYAHEVSVTNRINKLMDLAREKSDYATQNFLQWFIGEQVEEEASVDEAVQKLKLVDKTEGGIFLLDQEMNKRTFVLPPELAGAF